MTRFRDLFKKVQPLPDPFRPILPRLPRFDVFQCTDPACPRCHGTGKYYVLDPNHPIVRWVVDPARIDLPAISKREVTCIKIVPIPQGLDDPRSPEEHRISEELKQFTDERRIYNG